MQLGIRTIKVAKQLTSGSIFFFNVKSYQMSAFFIENVNLAFSFTPYLAFVDLFFKRLNEKLTTILRCSQCSVIFQNILYW